MGHSPRTQFRCPPPPPVLARALVLGQIRVRLASFLSPHPTPSILPAVSPTELKLPRFPRTRLLPKRSKVDHQKLDTFAFALTPAKTKVDSYQKANTTFATPTITTTSPPLRITLNNHTARSSTTTRIRQKHPQGLPLYFHFGDDWCFTTSIDLSPVIDIPPLFASPTALASSYRTTRPLASLEHLA